MSAISSILYALFGLLEGLLLFRFVFRLVGANPDNPFVAWIYSLSGPLVAPFSGIFGSSPTAAGAVVTSVFEWAAIVAIIVYGVIGTILLRLVGAASGGSRP